MRQTLKASMTAILLSSVALVPAATVVTIASVDAAFAKSDNAGGKGGGNSGKAKEKAQGKSGAKKGGGKKSGSKSASSRGKGGGIGGFFDKLTGKDKRAARSAKVSAKPAKGSGMHPSELGNMNGALNANINAVLAHIRNGNTNGPVGHLAALAVAADGAIGAQDLIEQEVEFQHLDDLLGMGGENYSNLAEYYDYRNGIEPIGEIDEAAAAIAVLDAAETDPLDPAYTDAEAALATALSNNDYADLDTYEGDVIGHFEDEGFDTSVDSAITDLGGNAGAESDFTDIRPSEQEIADASDALEAQGDAEADILDYWNKNEGDVDAENALLDKLYDRLVGNEGAISDAIGEPEMDEEIGEDIAECEGAEDCLNEDDMAELIE